MKIFMDLEFTGLHQFTTPISIGLVSENDQELYIEFCDYDDKQVDEWILDNVINNLEKEHPQTPYTYHHEQYKVSRQVGGTVIYQWLKRLPNRPHQIWGDCLAYDWVLFCQLFGGARNIPEWISYIPMDICTLFEIKGFNPDIHRETFAMIDIDVDDIHHLKAKKHQAIWDAKIIRECYNKLVSKN